MSPNMTKAQDLGLYKRLPTACTLCEVSLEQCAIGMSPARDYSLFVRRTMWPFACMLVRQIGANVQHHPFAPYINVTVYEYLEPTEWFIQGIHAECFGSEGL